MGIIEIKDQNGFERASKILEHAGIEYSTQKSNKKDLDNFIYVPSINLWVAKQRTHVGKNWNECHKLLNKDEKMLTIPEFIEFLKYTKKNHKDIYNEITEVKNPWRAEWIDADFKVQGKNLIVNYHVFDSNENIIQKSEVLDKNTLMTNRELFGISLEDYLFNNHSPQGLPSKKVQYGDGDLYYWPPGKDNNSVAAFGADSFGAYMDCYRYLSNVYPYHAVRAAKLRK